MSDSQVIVNGVIFLRPIKFHQAGGIITIKNGAEYIESLRKITPRI